MRKRSLQLVAWMILPGAWCGLCGCGTSLSALGERPAGGSTGMDDGSVRDVVQGGGGGEVSDGNLETVRARVRNESDARADVTIRFIRDGIVVHLAFVRVPTATATTVVSVESADQVELSGVDGRGRALPDAVYLFGIDFDTTRPAEYVVESELRPDPVPPQPLPPPEGPVGLALLQPAEDVSLPVGGSLAVRWEDQNVSASAVVQIMLEPVGAASAGDRILVGPAVGAALDGLNDEFVAIIQEVPEGRYHVVARLQDGDQSVTAAAAGIVHVVPSPTNTAPTIRVLEVVVPDEGVREGQVITATWEDADPDDNATVSFALEAPSSAGIARRFALGPPIAEDPDGPGADSARLVVSGALPGLYDLVATIEDGELVGQDRVAGTIRVLSERDNDPPQLLLLEPANDLAVEPGMTFVARWVDADSNDNAQISLLLDRGLLGAGLGGEVFVVADGISEDGDDAADQLVIHVPAHIPPAAYRLAGIVEDGLTEVVTHAPGLIRVVPPAGDGNDSGDENDDGTDPGPGIDKPDDPGDDQEPPPEPDPDPKPEPEPDPGPGPEPDPGPGPKPEPDPDPGPEPDDGDGDNTPKEVVPIDVSWELSDRTDARLVVEVRRVPAPPSLPARLRLTNVPYGGTTTASVVPLDWVVTTDDTLRIIIPADVLLHEDEPQVYDVTVELSDGESILGLLHSAEAIDVAAAVHQVSSSTSAR